MKYSLERAGWRVALVLVAAGLTRPVLTHADNPNHAVKCQSSSYSLDAFSSGKTAIAAPNNRGRVLLAKDFSFRVFMGDHKLGAIRLKDLSSNIGVIWSPDSRKFLINYSDGGSVGGFHVHVYSVGPNSVTEIPKPPAVAFNDFKSRYYCEARGDNIEGIGWTVDSTAVFFIASVYPTSDCAPIWDKALGYLVSLQGKLIRRYTQKEAGIIRASCEKTGRAILPDRPKRASH